MRKWMPNRDFLADKGFDMAIGAPLGSIATIGFSALFGWLSWQPLVIGVLLTVSVVAFVEFVRYERRRANKVEGDERVLRTNQRIRVLAERIPLTSGLIGMPTSTLMDVIAGSVESDWKSETKAGLAGMLKPDIVEQYVQCFHSSAKERSAKEFLIALSTTLNRSDLRDSAE